MKTKIIAAMLLLFIGGFIMAQGLGNYLQASIQVEPEDKQILDANNIERYYIGSLKCNEIKCNTVYIREESGLINSPITPKRFDTLINETTNEPYDVSRNLEDIQAQVNDYAVKRVGDLVNRLKEEQGGEMAEVQQALNVTITEEK